MLLMEISILDLNMNSAKMHKKFCFMFCFVFYYFNLIFYVIICNFQNFKKLTEIVHPTIFNITFSTNNMSKSMCRMVVIHTRIGIRIFTSSG
jgi:hypothetical protein